MNKNLKHQKKRLHVNKLFNLNPKRTRQKSPNLHFWAVLERTQRCHLNGLRTGQRVVEGMVGNGQARREALAVIFLFQSKEEGA
jgi:hypothetical protein